jgi:acyl-homoserine lactone acylase PvdQ
MLEIMITDFAESPPISFLFADADGHIGFQSAGRVPLRPSVNDGEWPTSSANGTSKWIVRLLLLKQQVVLHRRISF